MDIPPFSPRTLTLRQAKEVYHDCLEFVMAHQGEMESLDQHPVGKSLFGVYQAFMRLSNIVEDCPRIGTMTPSQLSIVKFSDEERTALKEAPTHIAAALRMRHDTVRGFAEVMQRSIREHVRDVPRMTGL